MRVKLIDPITFKFNDAISLNTLSNNTPNIYFWTLPTSKNNLEKLPIYIGESSNTKSRFETHLKNLLLGEYWILNERYAEDYYDFISKNMTYPTSTWIEILDAFPNKIDANYRASKFEELLEVENRIKTRIEYLKNVTIYVYKIQNIENGELISEKNLRKMIEAQLIRNYEKIILELPSMINNKITTLQNPIRHGKDKRKAGSNVTFLGAISLYPQEDLVIEIVNFDQLLK